MFKGHFCEETGGIDALQRRGWGNYLLWLVDAIFRLSNEHVCGCQNNLRITSIRNDTKFPVNTGCAVTLVSTVQNKAATHDPRAAAAAAGLWRAVSFNTALFMHSSVPLWLLYLSSVLWLLHRPPQLLSPARAYVTQRQIWIQLVQSLSRSTLYTAFTATEDPWATS